MIDNSAYPTEEELEKLKVYAGHISLKNPIENMSIKKLLNLLYDIWYIPDWGFIHDGYQLQLHTAGWSGNEQIIGILKDTIFWHMYWQKSERGGHYYFELPKGRDK